MAPDEPPTGRRRALLVATATYSDPALAALRAPTGDVAALAAVLGDEAIGGFEVEQLIDHPAEDLRREIETFFGEGRPQDLLLFYVSGHGVLSQSRRFYFATANTSLGLLRSTAIEDGFVNDVMQSSRARSIVLVLDCCHSGAFGKGLAPKSATTVDVEHRFEGRGRVTLSASTELEYAFEETDPSGINELGPAAPGSLFTRSLVEGLQSGDADIDEDGRITVDDLYDYVCRRVRERSVHQTPGMAGDVRGQIVIARSRAQRRRCRRSSRARSRATWPASARARSAELARCSRRRLRRRRRHARGRSSGSPRTTAAACRRGRRRPRSAARRRPRAPPRASLPPPAEPPGRAATPPPPALLIAGAARCRGRRSRSRSRSLLLGGGGASPPGRAGKGPYIFTPGSRLPGRARAHRRIRAAAARRRPGSCSSTADDPAAALINGRSGGVPKPADADDGFGTAVASGDFDGDGKADLAVGDARPRRRLGALRRRTTAAVHRLAQARRAARRWSRFGAALLARDFNDDGYADLVVGAPGAVRRKDSTTGSIHILFGGAKDLSAGNARTASAKPLRDDSGRRLRRACCAAGDINGDEHVDLVEGRWPRRQTGHLTYCLGHADGPPTSCHALVRRTATADDVARGRRPRRRSARTTSSRATRHRR